MGAGAITPDEWYGLQRRSVLSAARAQFRAGRADLLAVRASRGALPAGAKLASDLSIDLAAASAITQAAGGALRLIGSEEIAATRGTVADARVVAAAANIPRDAEHHPALALCRDGEPMLAPPSEVIRRFPAMGPVLRELDGGPMMLVPIRPTADVSGILALELPRQSTLAASDRDIALMLMEETTRRFARRCAAMGRPREASAPAPPPPRLA